ncbi:bactofilin family protein [Fodinibius salsisoli]|uniref:Polymer-forming cytoskeletal protein n=1 Tax=Fodinibius salsisoli TaxID=2820877 RepID=A0ABT3PN38_9BACT|nr:polymer-forming cytoskeletal protein [Fodinibius salsisoli]MCW9707376.1 polymer-forming cytoskeletal protein [Fodinibius salsisoli]
MFNNNNNKKEKNSNTSMSSNNSDKNLPSVNMISEGTTLEGTIKTKNDIRIAGVINGEANAEGKVIVASSGKVKGNIKASGADIAGKVDGQIKVSKKLILRESALVEGDIYTETLLVEEGAQINGEFRMTEDKSSSTASSKAKTNGFSGKKKAKQTPKKDQSKKA